MKEISYSKILLVAKNAHLYFFDSLNNIDVISGRRLVHFIKSDLGKHRLARYQLIIFLDSGFKANYPNIVKDFTEAKMILFFWNHLTQKYIDLLHTSREIGVIDSYYSFDPIEAKKYGLYHNSTFYNPCINLPLQIPDYDLFFGGNDKGRTQRAHVILDKCASLDISILLYIINGEKGFKNKGYLPYPKFLEFLINSNGILEIMQENQTGLTLRTMEAIFFKKKLVTTNKAIKHYLFYHPDNIFILREDSIENLSNFLEKDYHPLEHDKINFFESQNWFDRFLFPEKELLNIEYRDSLLDG